MVTHGRGSKGEIGEWNVVYPASLPLMRTPRLPAVYWTDAPRRFKWTRPFRRKTKSGFCACVITFQTQSTTNNAIKKGIQGLQKPWQAWAILPTTPGVYLTLTPYIQYSKSQIFAYEASHDAVKEKTVKYMTRVRSKNKLSFFYLSRASAAYINTHSSCRCSVINIVTTCAGHRRYHVHCS